MKILEKKSLLDILKTWAREYHLLCPSKTGPGDIIFDTFNENTFTADYKKPHLPPKSSFLPHTQKIFEVENSEYRMVESHEKKLLFGIRACDMMGIRQSTSFMTRDLVDPYYSRRIDSTLCVVMACRGPQSETCFCTTTRSGPWAESGFELQFFDMGDFFLVESGSERADALLDNSLFSEADEISTKDQLDAWKKSSSESIPEIPQVNQAMSMLKDRTSNEEIWDYFGSKCIICGGCAFVCPTCTCFNVYDHISSPANGSRSRSWDACLYAGFTKEASGHNPRGDQGLRLKRRHEHKLLYFNETDIQDALCGCVGCGRCSDFCPVHIGTLEVVRTIVDGRTAKAGSTDKS